MNIDFAPGEATLKSTTSSGSSLGDLLRSDSHFGQPSEEVPATSVSRGSHSVHSYMYKDHVFFNGPRILLLLAGIHRIGKWIPAYFIAGVMWLAWLFQVVYAIEQIFTNKNYYFIYQRIASLIWFLHGILIYSIITNTIFRHQPSTTDRYHKYFGGMESLLRAGVVKRGQCDERACASREEVTNKAEQKLLTSLAKVLSVLSIALVLVNTTIVGHQFIGGSQWENYFPTARSVWATVPATMLWYFVAYGWSMSIVFVCLPTYVFTLRVQEYAAYVEESTSSFDIEQAMSWYDDLYQSNKILNDMASPLVTINVALCFPLTVFLILSYTNKEVSKTSAVAWIVINTVIMLMSTGSVANLYAVNYRISMGLGEKSSFVQFRETQIAGYQMALLKIQAIPLGVRFFSTRLFITPSLVLRALTLVSSFFVFLNANNVQ